MPIWGNQLEPHRNTRRSTAEQTGRPDAIGASAGVGGRGFCSGGIHENGRNTIKEVLILGRALRSTSKNLDSIGLMTGLQVLEKFYSTENGKASTTCDTLITNVEQRSIKDADQRCRWRTYGTTGCPAPDQGELNRLLQFWTNQE